jgi:hypothetical protein
LPGWNAITPSGTSIPTAASTNSSCSNPPRRSSSPSALNCAAGNPTQLRAEPRIVGSLFRITNDLRFAKDKPP